MNEFSFRDMVKEYGIDYLAEVDNDRAPKDMENFNEIMCQFSPSEIMKYSICGYDYSNGGNTFNYDADYFAFDLYGVMLSISDSNLLDYLCDNIDEKEFADWCIKHNYFAF